MLFVERKKPINLSNNEFYLFQNELFKLFSLSKLYKFSLLLIDSNGSFISPKKYSIRFSVNTNFYKPSLLKYILFVIKILFKGKIVFIKSYSMWFTDDWSFGYFHWMLDALPRLHESGVNKEIKILLPSHFAPLQYVLPSLYALGYKNVKFMQRNKYYLFTDLLFNTHSAPTGNYNEKTVQQLRETFRICLKDDSINLGERIFVSRQKAERRKILNETDLHFLLKSYGFSIVHFEDYSWNEQVAICSKAKYMIGLHGAGLSNMLFMSENSIVFELRKTHDSHNNCYFSLASALGHSYYYMQCNTNAKEILNADLIVDKQEFKQVLEIIFNTNH